MEFNQSFEVKDSCRNLQGILIDDEGNGIAPENTHNMTANNFTAACGNG
ncbi:hypothetical protein [Bacillus sp. P14.5]|nr:hypothetical protein [Bacillus sp. P14.5]